MNADVADLGPFAPDEGSLNKVAGAAFLVALAAVVLAAVRPILSSVSGGEPKAPGSIAVALGASAVFIGLVGGYQAVARAERGRQLARLALYVGGAAALFAYGYAAVADGTIDLGQLGLQYFNRDVMGAIWRDLLRGLRITMQQASVSEALAILVGLIMASAQLSKRRLFRWLGVVYVDVIRGLPLIVLAFIVYFGTPRIGLTLDPFPAVVIILVLNASAYCAEIFRAGIQSVPRGQTDAARSLGMPYSMTLLFVLIPQAFRSVIPPLVNEFIALIKDTALVGYVVGYTALTADLFGVARTAVASTFNATPYILAGAFYLVVTVPSARLVGVLERRLRVGLA